MNADGELRIEIVREQEDNGEYISRDTVPVHRAAVHQLDVQTLLCNIVPCSAFRLLSKACLHSGMDACHWRMCG